MKEINERNYITILPWMVTELGLKGNELIVFAIIHGISQDNASCFYGSVSYLQAWTLLSYPAVHTILKNLVAKGLLEKHSEDHNGVILCRYKTLYPIKKLNTPSKESLDNNKDDIKISSNEDNNISINPKPLKFDFRKALLSAGVEPEVADAWLQVRKAKKAVNTEIAWKAIEREIAKTANTANECIRYAVEHSWCGFKAEWCENATARSTRPATGTERNARRGGDYMNTMAGVAAELGLIGGSFDEQ